MARPEPAGVTGAAPVVLEARGVERWLGAGAARSQVLQAGSTSTSATGEFAAMIGPSGSGKSTLLYLLGGLDRPDAGSIRIDGVDIARASDAALARLRNELIGFVYQFHFLLPEFTALENVLMPLLGPRPRQLARRPGVGRGAAGPGRPRRQVAPAAARALRRRAAAGRDRARAGQPAADPAGRRADRQPRHDERAHGLRAVPGAEPCARADHPRRHPRPGLGGAQRPRAAAARRPAGGRRVPAEG